MTRDLLELSITHTKMGDTLFAAGRHEEALEAHRKSLAIREKLAAAEPRNVGRQQQLSMSYDAIGDVLVAAGRHEEAFDTYRKGLAIAERLAAADPGNADLRLELSVRYLHVGERLLEADPRDEVLEIYREGLAIAEKVDRSRSGRAQRRGPRNPSERHCDRRKARCRGTAQCSMARGLGALPPTARNSARRADRTDVDGGLGR